MQRQPASQISSCRSFTPVGAAGAAAAGDGVKIASEEEEVRYTATRRRDAEGLLNLFKVLGVRNKKKGLTCV